MSSNPLTIQRSKVWEKIADKDQGLNVFMRLDEALENILGDFASSASKYYSISSSAGSLDQSLRAQVPQADDITGINYIY